MSPTLTRTAEFVVYPSALKATAKQCQVDLLRESLKEEEKEVPLVQRQAEQAFPTGQDGLNGMQDCKTWFVKFPREALAKSLTVRIPAEKT